MAKLNTISECEKILNARSQALASFLQEIKENDAFSDAKKLSIFNCALQLIKILDFQRQEELIKSAQFKHLKNNIKPENQFYTDYESTTELDVVYGDAILYNQILKINEYKSEEGSRLLFDYLLHPLIEKNEILIRQQITCMMVENERFTHYFAQVIHNNSGIQRQICELLRIHEKLQNKISSTMLSKKEQMIQIALMKNRIKTIIFYLDEFNHTLNSKGQYQKIFEYFNSFQVSVQIKEMIKEFDEIMVYCNDRFLFRNPAIMQAYEQQNKGIKEISDLIQTKAKQLRQKYKMRDLINQGREEYQARLIFQSTEQINSDELIKTNPQKNYYESPEINEMFQKKNDLLVVHNQFLHEQMLIYGNVLKRYIPFIQQLIHILASMITHYQLAIFQQHFPKSCLPIILDESACLLSFKDAYHPWKKSQKYSLILKDQKACILDGPICEEKASFLKMVSMNIILAQIGSYVPAIEFIIVPFKKIVNKLQRKQENDEVCNSLNEINELKQISTGITANSLILLNEICTAKHDSEFLPGLIEFFVQQNVITLISTSQQALQKMFTSKVKFLTINNNCSQVIANQLITSDERIVEK